MTLTFTAKIRETKNCTGIWLNTILVRKKDGELVVLDRDATEYSISEDRHTAQIEWQGVYAWDSKTSTADYNLHTEDFEGAILCNYEVEEDADEDYELRINENSLCFC